MLAETWRNEDRYQAASGSAQTLGIGGSARAAALQSYCREIWSVMWPTIKTVKRR